MRKETLLVYDFLASEEKQPASFEHLTVPHLVEILRDRLVRMGFPLRDAESRTTVYKERFVSYFDDIQAILSTVNISFTHHHPRPGSKLSTYSAVAHHPFSHDTRDRLLSNIYSHVPLTKTPTNPDSPRPQPDPHVLSLTHALRNLLDHHKFPLDVDVISIAELYEFFGRAYSTILISKSLKQIGARPLGQVTRPDGTRVVAWAVRKPEYYEHLSAVGGRKSLNAHMRSTVPQVS